jgi:hypothetical protein
VCEPSLTGVNADVGDDAKPVRDDLCDDLAPPGQVSDGAQEEAGEEGVAEGTGGEAAVEKMADWKNLIRIAGEPVKCPFPGDYSFTYEKGKRKSCLNSLAFCAFTPTFGRVKCVLTFSANRVFQPSEAAYVELICVVWLTTSIDSQIYVPKKTYRGKRILKLPSAARNKGSL